MIDLSSNDESIADPMERIHVLTERVWEHRVSEADVRQWLENFDGRILDNDDEQRNALHLLSHFTYFGLEEVRQLLKAMYRDLFRYPLVQEARARHQQTRDASLLQSEFDVKLRRTRFLGVGGPAESGHHLLYLFRQENHLPPNPFLGSVAEILRTRPDGSDEISVPDLERLVFIDDILGTGDQATRFHDTVLKRVQNAVQPAAGPVQLIYLTLFAKPTGLDRAREIFDHVDTVCELNDSESAFHESSHAYSSPPDGVTREAGERLAKEYGDLLTAGHGMGHGNDQLMLGLPHNVPDNTLPIFWEDNGLIPWTPIFRRVRKEDSW